MKKCIFGVFISAFITCACFLSCSGEDPLMAYSYDEPTIYSSSDKVSFSNLLFFLKPCVLQNGEKRYIVTDSLYNISIKINKSLRKVSNSFPVDTMHLYGKETVGVYRATTEHVHYPVNINIQVKPEHFNTAGQYADLLNNYFTLVPGAYIVQIESFDIKTIEGNFQTIYTPSLSVPLIVESNSVSTNLGELEVIIK